MAKVVFTKHALEKMALRNVTKAEVKALVTSESLVVTEGDPPREGEDPTEWRRGKVEGRPLKVLVTKTDPLRVVTVARPDE